MDQRDTPSWATIELTSLGEQKILDGTLERSLRKDLGVDANHPIFIPVHVHRRKQRVTAITLVEGYVFVASSLPETVLFALENKGYVASVLSGLSVSKIRTLHTVPNRHIQTLRNQLRDKIASKIVPGMKVRAISGTFRTLVGDVVGVEGDVAQVLFKLRSLERLAQIDRFMLEEVDPNLIHEYEEISE